MSKAFDFASGLGGLNLLMAAGADDESFDSVTPRPAATRGSTRSSGPVSDVFVSPVSRLSTGVSVGVEVLTSLCHFYMWRIVKNTAPVGLVPPGLR